MKKLVLLLLFVSITSGFFTESRADNNDTPKKEIIIKSQPSSTTHTHRAPAKIMIEACYDTFMSGIVINFLQDLNKVEINVTNHSTGEFIEGTVTAALGVTMLPISETNGFYTITFTLLNGTEYYGEFEL